MHLHQPSVLTAAVLAALCQYPSDPAAAQAGAGVRGRIEALKRSTLEHTSAEGPCSSDLSRRWSSNGAC